MARVFYTQKLAQYLPPGPYGPAYGGESAGLDLYAVEDREIAPGSHPHQEPEDRFRVLIPTGIHLILEPNEVGLILERGSVVKTPLKVRAGVIDPGFIGEVFVNAVNIGTQVFDAKAGDKLPFQLLVVPYVLPTTALVEDIDAELASVRSARGSGQIGSSD